MLLTEAFGLGFSQGEVDFVIPRLDEDLPLCIDPFLLYKSRDEVLRDLHSQLLGVFNDGVSLFESGELDDFHHLIDFPEPNEIGFGYSEGAIRGSGLGPHLNRVFADTLAASEPLRERRLRHIEELQLVSVNVGPDRISDIAANVLKQYLIDYTLKQSELWGIPVQKAVPVTHFLDLDDLEWRSAYFDLPQNPITGSPILLVPRRMVRLLPWINYEDYLSSEYRTFMRPETSRAWRGSRGTSGTKKPEVVQVTRENLAVLDQYVGRKEKQAANVAPAFVTRQDLGLPVRPLAGDFTARLTSLPSGTGAAHEYQRLIFEILNYLFEPELTDGEMEVRTIDGTERRDIIYTNESDSSFWQYIRLTYGSPFAMFESKNVERLSLENINQTAGYLGARLGHIGFIATRNAAGENIVRKTFTTYNDTSVTPRKVILILNDDDFKQMLRLRDEEGVVGSTRYVQRKYREFRTSVQ